MVEEDDLRRKIRKVQKRDKKVVKIVKKLKKTRIKTLENEEQIIEKEIVIKEGQIYIPEEDLRGKVIQLHYNTPVEGHKRRQKTIELVTRNYQ